MQINIIPTAVCNAKVWIEIVNCVLEYEAVLNHSDCAVSPILPWLTTSNHHPFGNKKHPDSEVVNNLFITLTMRWFCVLKLPFTRSWHISRSDFLCFEWTVKYRAVHLLLGKYDTYFTSFGDKNGKLFEIGSRSRWLEYILSICCSSLTLAINFDILNLFKSEIKLSQICY